MFPFDGFVISFGTPPPKPEQHQPPAEEAMTEPPAEEDTPEPSFTSPIPSWYFAIAALTAVLLLSLLFRLDRKLVQWWRRRAVASAKTAVVSQGDVSYDKGDGSELDKKPDEASSEKASAKPTEEKPSAEAGSDNDMQLMTKPSTKANPADARVPSKPRVKSSKAGACSDGESDAEAGQDDENPVDHSDNPGEQASEEKSLGPKNGESESCYDSDCSRSESTSQTVKSRSVRSRAKPPAENED